MNPFSVKKKRTVGKLYQSSEPMIEKQRSGDAMIGHIFIKWNYVVH